VAQLAVHSGKMLLACKRPWCHTRQFFKRPVKRRFGIKAAVEGHPQQREVRRGRIIYFALDFLHPVGIDEVVEIFSKTGIDEIRLLGNV